MNTQPDYRKATLPMDTRVRDLLSRMTLPEKVGQMMQADAQQDLETIILCQFAGSILHAEPGLIPKAIELAGQTRLGIPLLIADDCIHGYSFWNGATIFPTQLAMACAWNPDLLEKVARITAVEVSCTGVKWTFSPVLCLARDLRWGRINETFGEDPFLIGEFACAMIRGYQGQGLSDPTAILATAKHFAGYSETQGGRDASEADISRRKLKSYFLPPFERAAREGCLSFMTGYQSMDGVPITANRWVLKEILRDEWNWKGIVVTDWMNVGRMVWEQKICATYAEAAALAIRSGNDLSMTTPQFFEAAQEAVARGLITEAEIDEVVTRLLMLKFKLGLFENPGRPDVARQKAVIACKEHTEFNREVARQSLVLLKNSGVLPLLATPGKTMAVIGPNADDPQATLGDWAGASGQVKWMRGGHPRPMITTVLDGIRAHAPANWKVSHARGCDITYPAAAETASRNDGPTRPRIRAIAKPDPVMIAEAVTAAEKADFAVVVIGDDVHLNGEGNSTATLELQGGQLALLEALAATHTPLIIVLVNGKPLCLPEAVQKADAIIEVFNPGMCGGHAVAEAIFGLFNPSGKLTISFPRHVGQQPVYYSQTRGQHGSTYADLTQEPLFVFGDGLSYTTFAYSNLCIRTPVVRPDSALEVTVDVTNTGTRNGVEIVQLYTSDLVTSATWVNKELKAYQRIALKAGETRTVPFSVPVASLTLVNAECRRVVEPGEFEVLVGPNSRDKALLRAKFCVVG
ncbi:MAG: beta-glucosidase [Lentisphaerae bacterium]|nr:beta-glucosidase [Lentisphaerota bacterium]